MNVRLIVAVFTPDGLQAWSGYGAGDNLKALAELRGYAQAGYHTALYNLDPPDLEADALYDWIDSELVLAFSGLHDARFSTWLEYPAA